MSNWLNVTLAKKSQVHKTWNILASYCTWNSPLHTLILRWRYNQRHIVQSYFTGICIVSFIPLLYTIACFVFNWSTSETIWLLWISFLGIKIKYTTHLSEFFFLQTQIYELFCTDRLPKILRFKKYACVCKAMQVGIKTFPHVLVRNTVLLFSWQSWATLRATGLFCKSTQRVQLCF